MSLNVYHQGSTLAGMTLPVMSLIGAAVTLAVSLVLTEWRRRSATSALRTAQGEVTKLEGELKSLRRFRQIVDADSYAAELRANAQREATEHIAKAQREAQLVEEEARLARQRSQLDEQEERARTAKEAEDARKKIDSLLSTARDDATAIISKAQLRADEIASGAMEALHKSRELEKVAEAYTNVIEGYGDRYVVPSTGFLDDLADQFGFAEAGQKLKEAREHVRELARTGKAAVCDYVEEVRRRTAVAFVLDAFNGKVDSILADVRHDNGGTLERKLRDAFILVNRNGQAFRNARIAPEYLDARLAEMRWAVVANELKLKDREEQRALRERMREEELAQREFERAQKEAEKEEEMLRKAMEKVRREVEKANDEQRAKHQEQLVELADKLRAAEEKNQRALSMAQQTRAGHVYVISNVGSFGDDVYKIGLTRRLDPLDRVRELGDAGVPFPFDVHALIRSEDAPTLERALHKRFVHGQMNKVNPRKEFFRATIHEIRAAAESLGCESTWTIAGACREYKETLAIERAMKEGNPEARKWIRASFAEDISQPPPVPRSSRSRETAS